MIKIVIENNVIKISGHANYSESGSDIVCASVSSIVYTTVNALLRINENSLDFSDNKKEMRIEIKSEDKITKDLIDNMIFLLTDLSKDYPKNIKVESEE